MRQTGIPAAAVLLVGQIPAAAGLLVGQIPAAAGLLVRKTRITTEMQNIFEWQAREVEKVR